MTQTKSSANSSQMPNPRDEELYEMSWLKRASIYAFFAGIGFTISGIQTTVTNERVGNLILLTGLGVTVAGLVIWSSINILLKGSKNAES